MPEPAQVREQRRQDALLRLLRQPAALDNGDAAEATAGDLGLRANTFTGLKAHRAHAQVVSARALCSACPTVAAMLGDEAMATLAWALWLARPPLRGDLGEWGEGLAELIEGSLAPVASDDHAATDTTAARHTQLAQSLAAWPWLADTARLDLVRHRCARAPAHPLDACSLSQLGATDPAQVQLRLQPHVSVLRSRWPLMAIWQAHQLPASEQAEALAQALLAGADEAAPVVVWWSTGRPQVQDGAPGVRQATLPQADADWMRALASQSASLAQALDAAPAGFDFSAWLHQALQQGWLAGAVPWPPAAP